MPPLKEAADGSPVSALRRLGCPREDGRRLCAQHVGRDGHLRTPHGLDEYSRTARTRGLADGAWRHARGDGSNRRLLEAGVACPRRPRDPRARQCHAHPEHPGSEERQERCDVDRRSPGAGADSQQLRPANAHPGTARSHPHAQAAGARDRAAHAASTEDPRGRQCQADGSDQRHPRQRVDEPSCRPLWRARPIRSDWRT